MNDIMRPLYPFRVAGKHQDRKHHNATLFQVGDPHATKEDADRALADAERLFDEDGYQYRVQELVPGKDSGHRWKDLKA